MREFWGYTYNHIMKDGFECWPCACDDEMASRVSDVVRGMSLYLDTNETDLIVVHGDRSEALGAATAGSLRNVRIAHIEGGESSGTIDEHIRHAITKLSHYHFVANETARRRVKSLLENESRIFKIGSPEVDVMVRKDRPTLKSVSERYGIALEKGKYGIVLLHPVTTNLRETKNLAVDLMQAIGEFGSHQWVGIYPNDDLGRDLIFDNLIAGMNEKANCHTLPSMRHEHFVTLLENSALLVGNSSCGVRETPFLGIPSVNLGTRQNNRSECESIIQLPEPDSWSILSAMRSCWGRKLIGQPMFGDGKTAAKFLSVLSRDEFWDIPIQKVN
jgi:UDP-N-acetylglucosamine 2-epimerase (hydrolysing)